MRELLGRDARNSSRVRPYLGGDEVANDPSHSHSRYVIDFEDMPLRRAPEIGSWTELTVAQKAEAIRTGIVPTDYPEQVAADWPDLLDIVQQKVRSERQNSPNLAVRNFPWWRHWRSRPKLNRKIRGQSSIFATLFTSPQFMIARLRADTYFANSLNIFVFSSMSAFSVLQSRVHEVWARFFSSSMKDDLRYTPSDSFRNFPFPSEFEGETALEGAGDAYHAFRAQLMIARSEGLTKTYNRFNNPNEKAADIVKLRDLHDAMDRAVLNAYGWADLAERAKPVFEEEFGASEANCDTGKKKKPKYRYRWHAAFRDEVLARLLALNAERAEQERKAGIAYVASEDEAEDTAEDETEDDDLEDEDAQEDA